MVNKDEYIKCICIWNVFVAFAVRNVRNRALVAVLNCIKVADTILFRAAMTYINREGQKDRTKSL